MPIGYLVAAALVTVATFSAVMPPRRPHLLATAAFWLGLACNELPFLVLYWMIASTALAAAQHDIDTPIGLVALGLSVVNVFGLAVLVARSLRARTAVSEALGSGLGIQPVRRRRPWVRVLCAPLAVRRRDVERLADIRYGDARRHLLDVYRSRAHPTGGPVLVYLHGGAYVSGRKNREGRPLIYRLASLGWVCFSANYQLLPDARWPDHLIDAKRVLAWVRAHGHEYGADPSLLFMSGSSAGGHLSSIAALTPNDPALQPGFEDADTSVTAVVSCYGYYGAYYAHLRPPQAPLSSPLDYLRHDAPPFFIAHGDRDTVVPVSGAREFATRLREASANPVVYAELPGAQHAFDIFDSLRMDAVLDGVEAFVTWIHQGSGPLASR